MGSTIIIGAGAAGLMAGRRLSAAGYPVVLLEAATRAGGRIHTLPAVTTGGFSTYVEGGAEFVHGDLPHTHLLAKEAGISLETVSAQMVRLQQGEKPKKGHGGAMSKDWAELMRRMASLDEDLALADFLSEFFPGDRYLELRDSVGKMAEGYDLADLRRVSTRSLYREWSDEADEEEVRLRGGYGGLIEHLTRVCRDHGCRIHYSSAVSAIRWQRGRVEAITTNGRVFEGTRLIITASLGVLKRGFIRFFPELPTHQEAIARLGFGSVIKVLLEFRDPFWRDWKKKGRTLFMVSNEPAPVWWTQTPDDGLLLTCWIAGEPMRIFREGNQDQRIDTCLGSLGRLFSRDPEVLRKELTASMVLDWEEVPFICGGYSFETVDGAVDRVALATAVEDTLYFAGEAVYEGSAPGTVEAAFSSGNVVAEKILG